MKIIRNEFEEKEMELIANMKMKQKLDDNQQSENEQSQQLC